MIKGTSAKTFHLLRILFIGIMFLTWTCFPNTIRGAEPEINHSNTLSASHARMSAPTFVPNFQLTTDAQAYDVNPQPLVTLNFDDGSQTVYDTAFPILDAQGIPATYYFMTSLLTDQWKTQLKNLENHGWEIGSHSRTHPDLTTLSLAELITELSQSKSDLEAAGLTVSGFAYPYGIGANNDTVLRQVKQYYSYARSASLGYNTPIIGQYALKTQIVMSSTSTETLKSWVDDAIANRQWLILMLHTVDTTGDPYSISPANFSELVSYIKGKVDAGNISAVTARDGVTRYNQTYWNPIYDTNYSIQNHLAITNGRVLWYFGPDIADYLYDGYEWVESGKVRYYELNGAYHTIDVPSDVSLQFINPDKAIAQFILRSTDGAASVVSTVTLIPGSPLAEVNITGMQGTPTTLSLGKDLTRRFSVNDELLRTDGSIETGLRTYGDSSQSFFAFDGRTNLIRIMSHFGNKSHSEYSDYTKGEFRTSPISKAAELPYAWFVGGITFDTASLLSEAEAGTLNGGSTFYTGGNASPKTGNTGVVLDGSNESVTLQFAPPTRGNYTLSIRQKGATAGDQYRYQIDGGEASARTVTGTNFGYENITLQDLSAQGHTVTVSQASGEITVDYVLLIPTSRSSNTPPNVEFPADVAHRQVLNYAFLPLIVLDNHPQPSFACKLFTGD
jgi:peptidoglycan/xylan/chitin deacetylase (PgdA/CDA1 family)